VNVNVNVIVNVIVNVNVIVIVNVNVNVIDVCRHCLLRGSRIRAHCLPQRP